MGSGEAHTSLQGRALVRQVRQVPVIPVVPVAFVVPVRVGSAFNRYFFDIT